jgi:glutamine synthetase
LLKPVAVYPDPARHNAFLVMKEVITADGKPHPSNGLELINYDDNDFLMKIL